MPRKPKDLVEVVHTPRSPVVQVPKAPASEVDALVDTNKIAHVIEKMTGQKRISEQKGVLPHIASGSTILDTLISGSFLTEEGKLVCPGYPLRRIVEIYGPESSGKTTVALSAVAEQQRAGATVMYLDTEHALNHRYARACGVRFDDSLLLYAPDTMEDTFKTMMVGISLGVRLIVVDSVASLVPKDELDKPLDAAAKVGIVALKMAQTLPKFALWLAKYPRDKSKVSIPNHPGTTLVLLNQERSKIDTGGGKGKAPSDPNTTGGKALKFFTYLRLRFQKVQSETVKKMNPLTGKETFRPYGNVTMVKVVKTKVVGNQGDTAYIFIRYGYGLDDIYSLIVTGERQRVLQRQGAYYSFDGERFQGRDKFRAFLQEHPMKLEKLKNAVIQNLVEGSTKVSDDEITSDDEVVEMMHELNGQSEESESESEEEQTEVEAEDGYDGESEGEASE